ncbi:uncharacterized protein [Primulina eburnea]|uniref:uncharacterized protein n=1 Tax=Primulina eburnea TaxID=1245227 RepID=UPI003C6C5106
MATDPPKPPRKITPAFSPRRGRVKAQIFGSLAAEMSSLASRTGKVFSRLKRGGDGATSTTASSSVSASAATTPPPSAYVSDGDPDNA